MNGLLLLTGAVLVNIACTAAIQFLRDRAWRDELKRVSEESYWRGYVDTAMGRRRIPTIYSDRRVPESE
jgi:hypothetical protein